MKKYLLETFVSVQIIYRAQDFYKKVKNESKAAVKKKSSFCHIMGWLQIWVVPRPIPVSFLKDVS